MNNPDFPQRATKVEPTETDIIYFTLELPAKVSVEIYDLNGSKCAMIPAADFEAGEQSVDVKSGKFGIPPGKYVYYLQIADGNETRMICRAVIIS